jgi:hypothetical protein
MWRYADLEGFWPLKVSLGLYSEANPVIAIAFLLGSI